MKHEVSNCLKELGVPASIKGYHYLKDAIQITIDENGILPPITKVIYPNVALKYDTTPARVERAIRHAVEAAFERGNQELIDKVFRYTVSYSKGKATNAEFIAIVAEYLIQASETDDLKMSPFNI